MIELKTFEAVLRAVCEHVNASGHQDIRASDDPRGSLAGYACHDCLPGTAWAWWMAPVETIHDLPKNFVKEARTTSGRIKLITDVVKAALHAAAIYRPTAWERVLKV